MKLGTTLFSLFLTLGYAASEISLVNILKANQLGEEKKSMVDQQPGEVLFTSDESKVPEDMKKQCRKKKEGSINEEYKCWCYYYTADDKSDMTYFCCTNCYDTGCFPPSGKVLSADGTEIAMADLRTGTPVMAVDKNGELVESEVLGFLDRQPQKPTVYTTIDTSSGQSLTLTPTHVVFRSKEHFEEPTPVFASVVRIGDFIFEASNKTVLPSEVIGIQTHIERGAYNPMTKEGNLIVDGFMVSCYGSYPHELSHNFLRLARIFPSLVSFRLGSEEACEGPLTDPASEEGCGESIYVSIGKFLSGTFVERLFDGSFFPSSEIVGFPQMTSLLGASFEVLSETVRTW